MVRAELEIYDVFAPASAIEGTGGVITNWRGRSLDTGFAGPVLAVADASPHMDAVQRLSG